MTNLDSSHSGTGGPSEEPDRSSPSERRVAHLRHARYYIALADQADDQYLAGGDNITVGLALFDRERKQLDAARHRLQGYARDPEIDALLIADAVATAHIGDLRYAKQAERIPQLEQALEAARRREDQFAQGVFLGHLGTAYVDLSDPRRAIDFHQQHLALARAISNRHGEAAALGNLGNAYAALGDARQAINFFQQTLALVRSTNDQRGEAAALGNLGSAYAALGDPFKAIEFHQQHLALARAIGDRRGEAGALGNLGTAYITVGNPQRALDYCQQNLALARAIGDRQGEAGALGSLGVAYDDLGDIHQAINFHQQHLALAREIDDRQGEATALGNLGCAYYALGDARQALDFHQQHLALARKIGDQQGEGMALGNLGNVYLALGNIHQAIALYQQDLALARTIGNRERETHTSWNYGLVLVGLGEVTQALPLLEAALAFYQQIGHPGAASRANTIAHVRMHGTLPEQNDTSVTAGELPEEALQATRNRHTLEEASCRSTEEILAGLTPGLRTMLEGGDQAGMEAALAALPEQQRQFAMADLSVLQSQAMLVAQQEQQYQQLAALVRVIAAIAAGDDAPRQAVETQLAELEQAGWMLREPVTRLWAGERDRDALVAGLDQHDTRLIERALELVAAYERGALRTPTQVLAALPEALHTAVQNRDQAAFDAAFAALDMAEQTRVTALVAELRGKIEGDSRPPPPTPDERVAPLLTQPSPNINRVIERFLPQLGDIALAALGDETARQLAEVMLPVFEEHGWHIGDAVRCIWAGERNPATLTKGLDAQDSALVQQTLRLIAGGRNLIGVAYSRDINRARQQADRTFAQAHTATPQEREALAVRLATAAIHAEEWPGAPWQALAAHLRDLVAQLRLPQEQRSSDGAA